jgi:cytochrome c551/c552
MIRVILISIIFFLGCSENKTQKKYDAKELLKSKCASCHNLDIPPTLSDDELAPPMMAVAFHVHSLIPASNESQRVPNAIAFVVDYVHNPSQEKSFCDKTSLKHYGLMPSQKENVNKEELDAIARYIFTNYTQENLSKIQEQRNHFNALPEGEKLALKYKCFTCHRIDKKIVGPSFQEIAKKYPDAINKIQNSISQGSKKQWQNSNGAIMPAFEKISQKDLKVLSRWILDSNP